MEIVRRIEEQKYLMEKQLMERKNHSFFITERYKLNPFQKRGLF